MSRRARRIAALALLGVAMTGCTTAMAGQPVPVEDVVDSQPRPERPREIRLDGKNPCTLLPESDWARLHIDRPTSPKVREAYRSPGCHFHSNAAAINLTTVVTEGFSAWFDGTRRTVVADAEPVSGFPAIELTLDFDDLGCEVAVDTADGQYLLATVLVYRSQADRVPERCEYAHQVAESAMSTLVAP
ncbi:DUF3558 domain-containing protein [Actinokineospora iranica]|uniref:DUF3558 domain-containing protein n=1 Tax=Actinokineospora iranica TaxID=1271860 RepID=A0A1G6M4Q5_9PSEU|nr:DUF3558 domain-containing protein [Actinokineospora iranica]SDC50411.1 Protein of unknown function [Actinokineospora iranica]